MTENEVTEEEIRTNLESIQTEVEKTEDDPSSMEKERKKALSPEEKQARKKKIIRTSIIAVVIIGLSIGASFLGPSNMVPGIYEVQLTINYGGVNYSADFNITMAASANTERIEYIEHLGTTNNSYIVIANKAYKSSTHSLVEFRVGILDDVNNSFKDVELTSMTGIIYGEDMERKIRPTKIEEVNSVELNEKVTVTYFTMAVPFKAGTAMALLVLIAGLWISEIVPTIVGAFLVPIIIVISGISTTASALTPFFDPVIALFFGGFIIAEALKKHQIDRRLALGIVGNATIRPNLLLLILMALSAFLSMWMSNTASAAVMIPIAIAMVDQIKENDKNEDITGFKKALVLGIGYAASTGGIASVIGTPANPIAIAGLGNIGIEISFLKWFGFGLPFVIIFLLIIWGYLLLVFKPKVSKESLAETQIVFKEDLKKMGKLGKKEWATIIIFVLTILLWLLASPLQTWTKGVISLSSGIIALIAVVLIFGGNLLEPKDVKNVNWNALFLFGGGLCLGDALVSTGIGDWIASNMGIIEGKHYIIIALIVGGISLLVTAVASNTASAAMLIPLVIPIAVSLHVDPVMLAVIVAIGSSVDYALVFGTPPTMISYSTGYFKVKEIFRVGAVLDILGILLLSTVSVFLWVAFGLVWV
ncbi:MAG: DASS family sodium-coupled anion symporter [Candidatus Heimdallarchaeota archaeon]|nr:DASS family sodium-coupled anion symporter [Candidatus Heimdallarchaeota archaeon]